MTHIAIIDYGMGNLRSVAKAFEHVAPKARVSVTQDRRDILQADRVVFPGQGRPGGVSRPRLDPRLHTRIGSLGFAGRGARGGARQTVSGALPRPAGPVDLQRGKRLLTFSEENGGVDCLNVLPGRVVWFGELREPETGERLKVPHMGWNQVRQAGDHPLWRDIPQDSRFYFVHSYYLKPEEPALIAGQTRYGFDFASAVARDNIFAVQFHPEKSAQAGLRLLANFVDWNP